MGRRAKLATERTTPFAQRISALISMVPGRTRDEFADLIPGVSANSVRNWESGKNRPTMKSIEQIAQATGVSAEWILTGRGNMVSKKTMLEANNGDGDASAEMKLSSNVSVLTEMLPIYSAVETSEGCMQFNGQVIGRVQRPYLVSEANGGYGLFVITGDLYPAYEPGDIAFIDPAKPYIRGNVVLLTRVGEDGSRYGLFRILKDYTATEWTVERLYPERETKVLKRDVWSLCYKVVGKESR